MQGEWKGGCGMKWMLCKSNAQNPAPFHYYYHFFVFFYPVLYHVLTVIKD